MGVFHIFKIAQMVPNRATHHIYLCRTQTSYTVYYQYQASFESITKNNVATLTPSKKSSSLNYCDSSLRF